MSVRNHLYKQATILFGEYCQYLEEVNFENMFFFFTKAFYIRDIIIPLENYSHDYKILFVLPPAIVAKNPAIKALFANNLL